MASDLLHADDTPIRVLDRSLRDKGLGKGVRKGRRSGRMSASEPWSAIGPRTMASARGRALHRRERSIPSPRTGLEDHVHLHLKQSRGILQGEEDQQRVRGTVCLTNGYTGYAKLYQPEPDGTARFREAACWAHLRRDFHDIRAATRSGIAREAVDRIGALCDIERVRQKWIPVLSPDTRKNKRLESVW